MEEADGAVPAQGTAKQTTSRECLFALDGGDHKGELLKTNLYWFHKLKWATVGCEYFFIVVQVICDNEVGFIYTQQSS